MSDWTYAEAVAAARDRDLQHGADPDTWSLDEFSVFTNDVARFLAEIGELITAIAERLVPVLAHLADFFAGFDIFHPIPDDARPHRLGTGWVAWHEGRWRACERREGAWWWR